MSILTLDDRNPAVVYSPGWDQAGSKFEFNSTTSWTKVAGSTAKVTFRGTSISVYGTVSGGNPKSIAPTSVYSVDGGSPKIFQATQTGRAQYRVLFFDSGVLPDAVHSVEISHPILSDPLFLDLFLVSQVTTTPITPSLPVLPSSASASVTLSLPVANSTSVLPSSTPIPSSTPLPSSETTPDVTPTTPTSTTPLPTSSSEPTSSAADSAPSLPVVAAETKKSNAGAVAGGVIGGIVVLFLMVFGYIVWRRRRRDRLAMDALRFPPSTSWNNAGSGGTSAASRRRSFASNNTNMSMRNVPPPPQAGGSFSGSSPAPYQQPYGTPAMYPGGYAREYPQQQMQQQAAPYAASSLMSYAGSSSDPPAYGQPSATASQPQAQRQAYALPSQLVGAGAKTGGSYNRYQDNYQDAYGGVAPSTVPGPTSNANYSYENAPRSRVRLD
ncbi:hypothetical protein D9619_003789 [Psilocybe cf. subviscida]|uniref:Transmembrane protein n=1 Tax=Psilocybe cf. subviscida TaxID=2480587 RepID=A0A8H5AVY2_9AGAR|nr:hypothetical protein D9619_003789 [Psilocybe cf. subviscida]